MLFDFFFSFFAFILLFLYVYVEMEDILVEFSVKTEDNIEPLQSYCVMRLLKMIVLYGACVASSRFMPIVK